MKLYAVRVLRTGEAVGIFWVKNVKQLKDMLYATLRSMPCQYIVISEPSYVLWIGESPAMGIDRSAAFEENSPRADAEQNAISSFMEDTTLGGGLEKLLHEEITDWKIVVPPVHPIFIGRTR